MSRIFATMTEKKKKTNSVVNDRKMFERHELKILNSALLLYVCFGALLFDYVGDFQDSRTKGNKDDRNVEAITSLPELRLNSARRMWNITNRLNILYETNWTQLVLDELVEFERVLLESLVENKLQFEGQSLEVEKKKSSEESKNVAKSNSNKLRLRSIKRSLIHSVATITTIGKQHIRVLTVCLSVCLSGRLAIGRPATCQIDCSHDRSRDWRVYAQRRFA